MYFNIVPMDVYRKTTVSGFVDPEWQNITTISGTVCELKGSDQIRNNQKFADAHNMIMCASLYFDFVLEGDDLYFDSEYHRVIYVSQMKNVLPHVEILVGTSQGDHS